MFNMTYAIIGVLIGLVVEPVGRSMNHGVAAAPLWASNPLIKLLTTIAVFGFFIFSATFGFKYAIYAFIEVIVGVFISFTMARKAS